MNMQNIIDHIIEFFIAIGLSQTFIDRLIPFIVLFIIIVVAWLADLISRTIIVNIVLKIVGKTRVKWDDILFSRKILVSLSHIVAPVLIYLWLPWAIPDSIFLGFLKRLLIIYMLAVFLIFLSNFLTGLYTTYSETERLKNKSLKGLLPTLQVAIFFIVGILLFALLIAKEPLSSLTGSGASAALLMLVFKESIMGFV